MKVIQGVSAICLRVLSWHGATTYCSTLKFIYTRSTTKKFGYSRLKTLSRKNSAFSFKRYGAIHHLKRRGLTDPQDLFRGRKNRISVYFSSFIVPGDVKSQGSPPEYAVNQPRHSAK